MDLAHFAAGQFGNVERGGLFAHLATHRRAPSKMGRRDWIRRGPAAAARPTEEARNSLYTKTARCGQWILSAGRVVSSLTAAAQVLRGIALGTGECLFERFDNSLVRRDVSERQTSDHQAADAGRLQYERNCLHRRELARR